jgi:hypothetical protein
MAVERISLSEEIWKPVVGYEGYYEVSSLGRVWSVYRAGVKSGSILRASPTAKGYMKLRLNAPVGATRYVHSLVLTAFVGPRAGGRRRLMATAIRLTIGLRTSHGPLRRRTSETSAFTARNREEKVTTARS